MVRYARIGHKTVQFSKSHLFNPLPLIVGYDVDFCRAVAAAILGAGDKVEFTDASTTERFQLLLDGDVDVLSRITTATLSRDVQEASTGVGFAFTQPTFYDGMTFGGIPE